MAKKGKYAKPVKIKSVWKVKAKPVKTPKPPKTTYKPVKIPPRPIISSRITGLVYPRRKKDKKRRSNIEVRF